VNVIFGWFQDQFDEVTLDAAHRNGLGVGMPFELNQDLPYDDPAFRERLMTDVLSWVRRFRHHPAVWFWTPGNEVIHRLIFPSWLRKQSDQQREARADSFARFYVELIDRMHQADPDHPIIYRDAEEVYLGRIRDNLLRNGVRRPWFAYGANVYSPRLAEILRDWPRQGLDVPLLVSEYSPGGTGPRDRPDGLRTMWGTIRSYPDWVIGGAVYTWTTEGPEELDRIFGLVDASGRPRDGTLAAVAEVYRREAR
jgi:beta-galactosidase/beta-glucuronidase